MKLAEIQSMFQSAVLAGEAPRDAAVLGSIRDSRRVGRAMLFSVYVDAYRLRLAEFISNDFPTLRLCLGDEVFGRLVEDYISSGPSRHRNARWYASRLPDFMCGAEPWRANRCACDLALFERALADAFDAADEPTLAIDALRDVSVENWPRLVFAFHPSVAVIDLARGTARLYEALAEAREPATVRDGEETIIFWRSDDQSAYREVGEDERLALLEARQGKKFGDICTLLAFQGDDESVTGRVAGFLSQWFGDGLVARVSISA